MYTLKRGHYPKMKGGKKKKLLNIMEELLDVDHLTIGTIEQLEDRKKALLLAEDHKLKRKDERDKWEADKKRRSDEEEAAAAAAGLSLEDFKAKKKKLRMRLLRLSRRRLQMTLLLLLTKEQRRRTL